MDCNFWSSPCPRQNIDCIAKSCALADRNAGKCFIGAAPHPLSESYFWADTRQAVVLCMIGDISMGSHTQGGSRPYPLLAQPICRNVSGMLVEQFGGFFAWVIPFPGTLSHKTKKENKSSSTIREEIYWLKNKSPQKNSVRPKTGPNPWERQNQNPPSKRRGLVKAVLLPSNHLQGAFSSLLSMRLRTPVLVENLCKTPSKNLGF